MASSSRYFKRNAFLFLLIQTLIKICTQSGLGRCPKHEFMKNFNITKFSGQWFEVERSFYLMELTSSCTTIILQENNKGQIEVTARTVGKWSGIVRETQGVATTSKRDASVLQFRVNSKLPNALAKYLPGAGSYQILDTDYNNFAILWTCSSVGLAHIDLLWILARYNDIDVILRKTIYDFLSERKFDQERLILSNKNCTHA